jgi:hypothetical protein
VNSQELILLLGLVLPLLIAVCKQSGFSIQANALIATGVYIVFGVTSLIVSGQAITLDNLVVDVGIVTAAGTVAYNLFWQNLGVTTPGTLSWEQILTDITSIVKFGPGNQKPALDN